MIFREILLDRKLLRFLSALTWLSAALLVIGMVLYDGTPETAKLGTDSIQAFAYGVLACQIVSNHQRRSLGVAPKPDWVGISGLLLAGYFLFVVHRIAAERWQILLGLVVYAYVGWQERKQFKTNDA